MQLNKIELLDTAHVQIRYEKQLFDGELNRVHVGYHREVRAPGDDFSNLPQDVQAAVATWHTPERVAAFLSGIAPTGNRVKSLHIFANGNVETETAEELYDGEGTPTGERKLRTRHKPVEDITSLPGDAQTIINTIWGMTGT